jgi:uncharacterized protein YcfJ
MNINDKVTAATLEAMQSIRKSMAASPKFLAAVAVAAGMSAAQAGEYTTAGSQVGRVIGNEVGRASGNSGAAVVGSVLGGLAGTVLTRPMDEQATATKEEQAAAKKLTQAEQKAREKAAYDAAYEAERKRRDPNYSGMAKASDTANARYSTTNANLDSLKNRSAELVNQYYRQNPSQRGH